MYEEETDLVILVEKTIRDAKRSPEKINHSMAGKSLAPKPARKQSRVCVEDFGFDESPVIKRSRSKSDPYTGSAYSRTNDPVQYSRSISNDTSVSSEDVREPQKLRTRKFSLLNGSNKVAPMDLKNVERPRSEMPPYIKNARKATGKRPQSDQSPRQPRKETVDLADTDAEMPESKPAWQISGVYV